MSTEPEDHEALFNARLTTPYQEKVTFAGLARIWGARLNALEKVFADILASRDISQATGHSLDIRGRLVGIPRLSTDEETFRRYIRARIKVNRSSGTLQELMDIANVIIGAVEAKAWDYVPNQVLMDVLYGVPDDVLGVLISMLRVSRKASKALHLHSNSYPPAEAFAFAGGVGAGFGVGHLSRMDVL